VPLCRRAAGQGCRSFLCLNQELGIISPARSQLPEGTLPRRQPKPNRAAPGSGWGSQLGFATVAPAFY